MKHMELHILQSFPVTCLNRDDFNSPKMAFFGGVQRARVSSQSWKRAIRESAKSMNSSIFQGERTRLIIEPLQKELRNAGLDESKVVEAANDIGDELATLDTKLAKDSDRPRVKTMFFTSSNELRVMAQAYVETGKAKKAIRAAGPEVLKDAADISLFGRMVANDHSLTVEASAMFSHALSTHQVNNEPEFFSAVDDWQPESEPGAGMTGTIEFNSATYYRFVALNLDMLSDGSHLGSLSVDERKDVVQTFIRATLMAVPGARRNSMHGHTMPGLVLGVVREHGHPIQLVNAFEEPVFGQGIFEKSKKLLHDEEQRLDKTWKLDQHRVERVVMPEVDLDQFVSRMAAHVV